MQSFFPFTVAIELTKHEVDKTNLKWIIGSNWRTFKTLIDMFKTNNRQHNLTLSLLLHKKLTNSLVVCWIYTKTSWMGSRFMRERNGKEKFKSIFFVCKIYFLIFNSTWSQFSYFSFLLRVCLFVCKCIKEINILWYFYIPFFLLPFLAATILRKSFLYYFYFIVRRLLH